MSDFTDTVARFAVKAKANMDEQVRDITLTLFSSVINMSPVGNPELWAANQVAHNYNLQVRDSNTELRKNPDNLDSRGRLKHGLKSHDGMSITKPAGYTGGHFRGNWQTSIEAPITTTIDRIDPDGNTAKAEVETNMGGAGKVTYLVNNLPYANRLEYSGWSKQAPSGMVRVSMARLGQIVDDVTSKGSSS